MTMMMSASGLATPPISAIVIFRNERELLRQCLSAIRWCDELIAIDMASTDGSLEVARQFADRVYHVDPCPIAEPTRVAAARLATHDWILLADPDEIIPPLLSEQLRQTLREHPDAAAVKAPLRYYFKRKMLTGTIWSTPMNKRMLLNRRRCDLLPTCNRISQLRPGQSDIVIPHHPDTHIRHYWSDSYRSLIHRHFCRYAHTEAAAMVANGQRFSLKWAVRHPLQELRRTLRDFDGWRMGPRGFALSAIYFGYVLASDWLTLYYQRRADRSRPILSEPPVLRPDATLARAA